MEAIRQWLRRSLGAGRSGSSVRPVVWVDASEVGLADLGRASADLVVVPEWGRRWELAEWLASRRDLRVVLEYEAGDRAMARVRGRSVVARFTWSGGTPREVRCTPGALMTRLSVEGEACGSAGIR